MKMKMKRTGKVIEAIRKRIRSSNARFKKLTKAQQRIAIAKDVIKQLAAEEIVAQSTYLETPTINQAWDELDESERRNRYEGIDTAEALCMEKCEVCGIGSLFVTAVKRADNLPFVDLLERGADENEGVRAVQVEYLEKWFPEEMLDMIEGYFEKYNYGNGSPILEQTDDNKRLKMIMENIISNRGKFDPYKGAHAID